MRGTSLPKLVPVLESSRNYKGDRKNDHKNLLNMNSTPQKIKEFYAMDGTGTITPKDLLERQPITKKTSSINLRISSKTNSKNNDRSIALSPAVVNLANPFVEK
tara:strand:- start:528 stop:839 length:312 start_codon:yes stop_codon:yes gene_type:complete